MCNNKCDLIRNLKYGYTTGICAAAAAKASATFQISGKIPDFVTIKNLENHEFNIKVFHENYNFYAIKDSGDDKSDITNGIKIFSNVEILNDLYGKISFIAGDGVGIVTLPGLKIPVGEPAINPVPRKIIERSLREIIPKNSLLITISIPDGQKIALKTFNPRLGIKNGLSILGTSGFVKPMDEKALLDSLSLELNMIKSLGFSEIYITFGNESEKYLRKIFNLSTRNVIQTGNYIGYVLDEAVKLNFNHAIIVGYPGKLLKVAAGSFNTHNKISDGRLEALCTHLALAGAPRDLISKVFHSNTTKQAVEIVNSNGFYFIWNNIAKIISKKCEERINGKLKVDTFINLSDIVNEIYETAKSKHIKISCAESCTGGLIGARFTELPGISEVFNGSAVVYSNEAKINILGVKPDTLENFGAVSEECALEMALGALNIYNSDIAVSVTGIAGPDGGSELKPVGTVCFGIAFKKNSEVLTETFKEIFSGNRSEVRSKTVDYALKSVLRIAKSLP